MYGALMRKRDGDTHTEGGRSFEDRGRDGSEAATSQGTLEIASKPPKARRQTWDRSFLGALRRNPPSPHLDFRLLV